MRFGIGAQHSTMWDCCQPVLECPRSNSYFTLSNSMSNVNVALGGMLGGLPRVP